MYINDFMFKMRNTWNNKRINCSYCV